MITIDNYLFVIFQFLEIFLSFFFLEMNKKLVLSKLFHHIKTNVQNYLKKLKIKSVIEKEQHQKKYLKDIMEKDFPMYLKAASLKLKMKKKSIQQKFVRTSNTYFIPNLKTNGIRP